MTAPSDCAMQIWRECLDKTYSSEQAAAVIRKAIDDAVAERDAEIAELRDTLAELADLMDDVYRGEYTPDSFTTQPARQALEARAAIAAMETPSRDAIRAEMLAEVVAWMRSHGVSSTMSALSYPLQAKFGRS